MVFLFSVFISARTHTRVDKSKHAPQLNSHNEPFCVGLQAIQPPPSKKKQSSCDNGNSLQLHFYWQNDIFHSSSVGNKSPWAQIRFILGKLSYSSAKQTHRRVSAAHRERLTTDKRLWLSVEWVAQLGWGWGGSGGEVRWLGWQRVAGVPGTHPKLIHANQGRWELWVLFCCCGSRHTQQEGSGTLHVCPSHSTHTKWFSWCSTFANL